MSYIEIEGNKRLLGEVSIQGSKNEALPILAGTILNKGITILHNCPMITDVFDMFRLLEKVGCIISLEKNTVIIDATNIKQYNFDNDATNIKKIRSSVMLAGALIGRLKSFSIITPGGCNIGERPIDLHLEAFKKMNISIETDKNLIVGNTNCIIGTEIFLPIPSVGATENIILAAVLSKGITKIYNCAREPEIVELIKYLNKMGALIKGAGTNIITIEGVNSLHDVEFTIQNDRIVLGTYMTAIAITKGEGAFTNIIPKDISYFIKILRKSGAYIKIGNDFIMIKQKKRPCSIGVVKTDVYPYFPTDMQSQFMVLQAISKGTCVIIENIFEARYMIVDELIKMKANIQVVGKMAIVKGVNKLYGAKTNAYDLRGGAALVIAGLAAEGITRINNKFYIDRGYENICNDLQQLGANIRECIE